MKKLFLFFLLIVFGTSIQAQSDDFDGVSITVTATNAKESDAKVRFMLYTQSNFDKKEALQSARAKVVNGKSVVIFSNVKPGDYAILCYEDANNNVIIDKKEDGTPKEKTGASNNRSQNGSSTWNNAKFSVGSENIELEINL
ncbi:hypothetical protein GCM10022393_29950 [Aquimarina addita]|uniref:DUF2141 domain-containing protein n=1 Tax=Aquimarina addita TaxID=870485 RepID=A0ABP6UQI4_9FLAO